MKKYRENFVAFEKEQLPGIGENLENLKKKKIFVKSGAVARRALLELKNGSALLLITPENLINIVENGYNEQKFSFTNVIPVAPPIQMTANMMGRGQVIPMARLANGMGPNGAGAMPNQQRMPHVAVMMDSQKVSNALTQSYPTQGTVMLPPGFGEQLLQSQASNSFSRATTIEEESSSSNEDSSHSCQES